MQSEGGMDVKLKRKRKRIELESGGRGMDVNNNMNGCVAWWRQWQWLPEDLIEEILLRLPATSLIRFKCVCKSWLTLISNNQFVRKHLNFNNSNHFNSVAFVSLTQHSDGFLNSVSVMSIPTSPRDEDQLTALMLPEEIRNNNNGILILGHCDGLLLLVVIKLEVNAIDKILAIWNPSINKYKTLPLPNRFDCNDTLGMGYDPSIDDYKVVRISNHAPRRPPKVDVLTLKTNKWRTVEFVVLNNDVLKINKSNFNFFTFDQFVYDNNGGFFSISYYECMLLRFDLAEEKFQVLPMPPHRVSDNELVLRRVFLGSMGLPGTLCMGYIRKHEWENEVWIAKHETGWTWIKLFTIPTNLVQDHHPLLCLTRFGKVLFMAGDYEFAVYDPEQNSVKKLAIHGPQYHEIPRHVFPYIHSLVCL